MDTLLHIANVFLLVSFSVKSMLLLRALNLVAGGFFIAWAISFPEAIWSSVAWNALFGVVNVWRIYLAILERRPPKLTVEEQRIHREVFASMEAHAVRRLFDLAQWENGLPPALLVGAGAVSPRVWMVTEGEIVVSKDGRTVRHIGAGDFVGEASFLTRKPITGDVRVEQPVRFLSWAASDLERFMEGRPEFATGLQRILASSLVRKLNTATAEG